MEREKLLKYRGLAPIRFLNDFNAGLLTAEEYKLIREINKNDAWDKLDSYVEDINQTDQAAQEEGPIPARDKEERSASENGQCLELRTDVRIERNFYPVPNDVIDVLAPLQTPAEEVVYRRLVRMSYGWRRNYCRVSIPYLLKTSQIKSENTVRKALRGLIEKGHIAEYINERRRVDTNNDGTLYIVFLPYDIPGLPANQILSEWGSKNESPSKIDGAEKYDGGLLDAAPSKNKPHQKLRVQNLNPLVEKPEKSMSSRRGANFEGANTEGGAKSKGAKFEPPPPQKLKVQNLNPLAEKCEESTSTPGGAKIEGAKFEPIKNNNKHIFKDTLSPRAIVSGFYRGIGQQKITAAKRERAEDNFKELLHDGFKPEDIQFAVEWTLKNAKEEFYDFSIIKHTIGQAMAAKKKAEAGEAKKREKEKIAAQIEAEEKRRAEEEERIKVYKEGLDNEERARLRERAEAEIRDSGQYKEEFITEYLIEAKENNLIRERTGMKLSE